MAIRQLIFSYLLMYDVCSEKYFKDGWFFAAATP